MGKIAREKPVPPEELPAQPPEGISAEEWDDYRERYGSAWAEWRAARAARREEFHARRARRRRRVLIISVVLLALLAGLGYFGYWYTELRQRYAVAVPPPDAPPTVVVAVWINAVNARDFATADALSTPEGRADARAWAGCASLRLVDPNTNSIIFATPDSAQNTYLQTPDLSRAVEISISPDVSCTSPLWPFTAVPFGGNVNGADGYGAVQFEMTRSAADRRWLVSSVPSRKPKDIS